MPDITSALTALETTLVEVSDDVASATAEVSTAATSEEVLLAGEAELERALERLQKIAKELDDRQTAVYAKAQAYQDSVSALRAKLTDADELGASRITDLEAVIETTLSIAAGTVAGGMTDEVTAYDAKTAADLSTADADLAAAEAAWKAAVATTATEREVLDDAEAAIKALATNAKALGAGVSAALDAADKATSDTLPYRAVVHLADATLDRPGLVDALDLDAGNFDVDDETGAVETAAKAAWDAARAAYETALADEITAQSALVLARAAHADARGTADLREANRLASLEDALADGTWPAA